MNRHIIFIGDPGPGKGSILDSLRGMGIEPRRLEPDPAALRAMDEDPPVAVVIGEDVGNRRALIAGIRERDTLLAVPVLALARDRSKEVVEAILEDGADDFMVNSDPRKLIALIALLEKADSWGIMRAPKGLALLAESRRDERIRIAHVLKRSGFDVAFASSAQDVRLALAAASPRIVVSSAEIAVEALEAFEADAAADPAAPGRRAPWIVMCDDCANLDGRMTSGHGAPTLSTIERRDGVDGITFVTNELLTPAPPNVRRSKRLLYSVPVRFGTEDGACAFDGYCYNINAGGLFIRTLTPMPMGSRVTVRLTPPFGRGAIVATAQVVWISEFKGVGEGSSPPGMGLQFVEWAAPDQAAYETGYEMLLARDEDRRVVRNLVTPFAGPSATTEPPPKWWSPQITA